MEEKLRRLACVGERIAEARERADYTQERLSVLMGASQDDVRSWEAGLSRPSIDQTVKPASVCSTTPDWLLGRDLIEEALREEAEHAYVCIHPHTSIHDLPVEDLDSIREFIAHVKQRRESRAGGAAPPSPPSPGHTLSTRPPIQGSNSLSVASCLSLLVLSKHADPGVRLSDTSSVCASLLSLRSPPTVHLSIG